MKEQENRKVNVKELEMNCTKTYGLAQWCA